jgi:hypothetical protein
MAINQIEDTEQNLKIDINNGDLKALEDIINNWKFKDKASALRFAIAVLKQSSRDSLGIRNKDGHVNLFQPGDELLNYNTRLMHIEYLSIFLW